jgi:hypothetical protein
MHARTKAGLEVLEKAKWFGRVGIKDNKTATFLSSWEEASKYCDSVNTHNFGLAACGQYDCRVAAASPTRYKKWDDSFVELKPIVRTFVQSKIKVIVKEHHLPQPFFEEMVFNAVLMACIELEYADVFSPGFHASLAYWYVKGHFPCGEKGIKYKGPHVPGKRYADMYTPGFYDAIAKWYVKGDFGDWQGAIPQGKLIVL